MSEFRTTIIMESSRVEYWENILSIKDGIFDEYRSADVIDSVTVYFGNGVEADIKLVNGFSPYIDNVLFFEGDEVDVPEITEDSPLGEYYFEFNKDTYIVEIVKS